MSKTDGMEISAFKMKNKDRYLVKCKWAVGFINRSREFVMDQDQTEWLIANLRPGTEQRLLTHYRDELVRIGAWGVKVEAKAETETLIAPPPATKSGNTGPRKVEPAKLSAPKKKKKPAPKAQAETSLSDILSAVTSLGAAFQTLSGRMDAVEEAATEPASSDAPFA